MGIQRELRQILGERCTLSVAQAEALGRELLRGDVPEIELAALLGGLAARGETAQEIAGFALALRAASVPLPLTEAEREQLVDTCGTGGDGSGTFNISTAAALVAAAAGAWVAKHGNRAVTSRCGSADVLEALGIPVDLTADQAVKALRQHGFCFLLASSHHPAMRAVLPVRRALGVRTLFNVLGPLLNPAGARRQVMGVYSARLVPLVAEAMTLLDTRHAFVVHGDALEATGGGQDELSLCGTSQVAEVRQGALRTFTLTPEPLGLGRAALETLAGGDAQQNAAMLRRIFAGGAGPARDAVVLNAAAVLVVAEKAEDLPQGVRIAQSTLDSGAVERLVRDLGYSR